MLVSQEESCFMGLVKFWFSYFVATSFTMQWHVIRLLRENNVVICLFSWRYNPFGSIFHSPVGGFSLLILEVSWSHNDAPQSVGLRWTSDQSVAETSTWQHTQQSQQKNIHAPGGIRTHNLNGRAAVDLRLRPRGHWDRLLTEDNTNFKRKTEILLENTDRRPEERKVFHY